MATEKYGSEKVTAWLQCYMTRYRTFFFHMTATAAWRLDARDGSFFFFSPCRFFFWSCGQRRGECGAAAAQETNILPQIAMLHKKIFFTWAFG